VAHFNGQDLPLDSAGALLPLGSATQRNWRQDIGDGSTVLFAEKSSHLIVLGLDPATALEEIAAAARFRANQALDIMAARSVGAHALRDASHAYLVWTTSAAGAILRIVTEAESTFSMTVGGPPAPASSVWHESMRYFRTSQATTDLFDAFRNLYLGLESLLSELESPVDAKGKPRPEGQWLRCALAAADAVLTASNPAMSLATYRPAGVAGNVADLDAVFDDLYGAVRTSIFHAKTGRPYVLPQSAPDRARIHEALQRYAGLYTDLAEIRLGTRFLRSGMSLDAFSQMAHAVLDNVRCGVTAEIYDDPNAFDTDGGPGFTPFTTARIPALDEPFRAVVRGELHLHESSLAATDAVVRSAGARDAEERGITIESLGGTLNLDGVDVLQHQLTWQGFNAGFRQRYDT
jgi:hypothetical protein